LLAATDEIGCDYIGWAAVVAVGVAVEVLI
jgi:hypothetical protein